MTIQILNLWDTKMLHRIAFVIGMFLFIVEPFEHFASNVVFLLCMAFYAMHEISKRQALLAVVTLACYLCACLWHFMHGTPLLHAIAGNAHMLLPDGADTHSVTVELLLMNNTVPGMLKALALCACVWLSLYAFAACYVFIVSVDAL
jgi:hypothetical protein